MFAKLGIPAMRFTCANIGKNQLPFKWNFHVRKVFVLIFLEISIGVSRKGIKRTLCSPVFCRSVENFIHFSHPLSIPLKERYAEDLGNKLGWRNLARQSGAQAQGLEKGDFSTRRIVKIPQRRDGGLATGSEGRGWTRNEQGRKIRARSVGREPWKNSRIFSRAVSGPLPTTPTNQNFMVKHFVYNGSRDLCIDLPQWMEPSWRIRP